MQFLTRESAAEWCATNGFGVAPGRLPRPQRPDGPAEEFEIPADAGRRVALASLALLFLWDCWLLPAGASRAAFVSHDEFGLAFFRDRVEHVAFQRKLEAFFGESIPSDRLRR